MINILFVVVILYWAFGRDKKAFLELNEWCKNNNYSLIVSRRSFFDHPFYKFNIVSGYYIFYIECTNSNNEHLHGFIRLGSFWLGFLTSCKEMILRIPLI